MPALWAAQVFATARRMGAMGGLQERGCALLQLDVQDAASCQVAIQSVIAQAGRIDMLVNNAGVAFTGMWSAWVILRAPSSELRAPSSELRAPSSELSWTCQLMTGRSELSCAVLPSHQQDASALAGALMTQAAPLADALHVPHAAGPLAEAPLGEVRQSLEVNLVAPLHLAQLVRPRQPVVLYG